MTQPTLPGLEPDERDVDPSQGCTDLCLEVLRTDPDAFYVDLYARCRARWPEYVEGLTAVQFHARHCLPAKRALHRE